jgi:Fe-S-cluster containining protein
MTPMKSKTDANKSPREPDLADTVARCSADASMMERLGRIYESADRAVARTKAVCLGGGACCRFDLFAHRLYLTPAELAMLVSHPAPDSTCAGPGRCPYQNGPRCVAYSRRPLGCRIFFCRGEKQLFERLYERYHREIRSLHESCCIPYSYGELTSCFLQLFPDE